MAKNLRKPKIGVKNPVAAALLLSFGCGVGVCILLLALAAFLLTHTGLPLSAVRPMACMAAAVGAAVSAAVLARRLRKRLLLCGLGCGAFYAVCLLAATLLANGRLDWQGSNAMLPLALLLGGRFGFKELPSNMLPVSQLEAILGAYLGIIMADTKTGYNCKIKSQYNNIEVIGLDL